MNNRDACVLNTYTSCLARNARRYCVEDATVTADGKNKWKDNNKADGLR